MTRQPCGRSSLLQNNNQIVPSYFRYSDTLYKWGHKTTLKYHLPQKLIDASILSLGSSLCYRFTREVHPLCLIKINKRFYLSWYQPGSSPHSRSTSVLSSKVANWLWVICMRLGGGTDHLSSRVHAPGQWLLALENDSNGLKQKDLEMAATPVLL